MNACSFLPAATQMIYDMGLQHLLKGITFECPPEALAEKDRVVRCVLEGNNYSSEEIDRIFSASKAQGKSLYYVDEELLGRIAPDVIFTQDVCEVCQIDTRCTQQAVSTLPKMPNLVPLSPNNLQDVFQCAIDIATALGQEEAAYRYLTPLQQRLDAVTDTLRQHRSPLRRVMIMEWMAPIYNCGHWIPYQVAYAGGVDMLSNPAGDSIVTPWEKIQRYDPEVLVIAPCGFLTDRSASELSLLTKLPGFNELQAVKNGETYLADYDLFTQPSAGTLVDGVELLAKLFHPSIFTMPQHLQHKWAPLQTSCVTA
ncbi:ABC transporter substrate-binding protein [uncultured Chitinophaga sp.]|uniref:ABC transporter substrate-binding protein n=1 Tax=uncultured Chitinophaga sp. TaxID=339340 RepID=UPI0025DC639D|nr:ABC transporter substrate-binding protein [uncultured Chitinophaga sp.]